MLMSLEHGADFSRECAGKKIGHSFLVTHPPLSSEKTEALQKDSGSIRK
jgi:hypothetical protein